MTTIDDKQQTTLRGMWTELEADGPVTLERLNERLSGYIAWEGMPTDDATHVLGVALPRLEKSIAGVGVAIARELRAGREEPLDECRELENRQLQVAAEALAVITSQDVWSMRCMLNGFVRDLQRREGPYIEREAWPR